MLLLKFESSDTKIESLFQNFTSSIRKSNSLETYDGKKLKTKKLTNLLSTNKSECYRRHSSGSAVVAGKTIKTTPNNIKKPLLKKEGQ